MPRGSSLSLGVMRLIDADPSIADLPDFGSGVSDRVLSLRQRECSSLTVGEIAFCLRQGIAIEHLAPLALNVLVDQPLVEAELYAGDLLASLLHAARKRNLSAAQAAELWDICSAALAGAESIQNNVVPAAAAFVDAKE